MGEKNEKNVIWRKKFTLCLSWGLNSGPVSLKAKALTTELWRLMIKIAHTRSIHFTAHYYSLQINWWTKIEMDNVDYSFLSEIEFFGPSDASQVLMATFWHAFFSACGASCFLQSGGGPWSPHNKHKTTSDCHLPDEILVYIDFFYVHTLRIA